MTAQEYQPIQELRKPFSWTSQHHQKYKVIITFWRSKKNGSSEIEQKSPRECRVSCQGSHSPNSQFFPWTSPETQALRTSAPQSPSRFRWVMEVTNVLAVWGGPFGEKTCQLNSRILSEISGFWYWPAAIGYGVTIHQPQAIMRKWTVRSGWTYITPISLWFMVAGRYIYTSYIYIYKYILLWWFISRTILRSKAQRTVPLLQPGLRWKHC